MLMLINNKYLIILLIAIKTIHAEEQSITNFDQFYAKQNKYLNNGQLEHVSFNSQHGLDSEQTITRNGVLLKRNNAKGTVILCHGFMCDKFDISFLRTIFTDFNVFTFDFRAHGESVDHNQCCTFGRDEAHDVIAAVNYIKSRNDIKNDVRIVYGFSMGAVAAIQAQAKDPSLFHCMVLDCPFDDSDTILNKGFENLKLNLFGYVIDIPGKSYLKQYAYNPYVQSFIKAILKTISNLDATATNTYIFPMVPVNEVKKIMVPCFFIHCKNDEKIVLDAAYNLYDNVQAPFKRLWITEGRRHYDSFFFNPEKYIYMVNKFILSILDGSYKNKINQKITKDLEE